MVAVTLKNEGATRGGRYLLYVGLRRRFDQQIGEENWLWENPNGRDFLPPPPRPPPLLLLLLLLSPLLLLLRLSGRDFFCIQVEKLPFSPSVFLISREFYRQ